MENNIEEGLIDNTKDQTYEKKCFTNSPTQQPIRNQVLYFAPIPRTEEEIRKATIRLEIMNGRELAWSCLFTLVASIFSVVSSLVLIVMVTQENGWSKQVFVFDMFLRSCAFVLIAIAFLCFCFRLFQYYQQNTESKKSTPWWDQFVILVLLGLFLFAPGFGILFIIRYEHNFQSWRDYASNENFSEEYWIINPVQGSYDDLSGEVSKALTALLMPLFLLSCYFLGHSMAYECQEGILKKWWTWIVISLSIFYVALVLSTSFIFDFIPSALPLVPFITILSTCTLDPKSLEFNGINLYDAGYIRDGTSTFCEDKEVVRRLVSQLVIFALEIVIIVAAFIFGSEATKTVKINKIKSKVQAYFFYKQLSLIIIGVLLVFGILEGFMIFAQPAHWLVTIKAGRISVDPLRISGVPFEFIGMSANCFLFASYLLLLSFLFSLAPKSKKEKVIRNIQFAHLENDDVKEEKNNEESTNKNKTMDILYQIRNSTKDEPIFVFETLKQMLYLSNLVYLVAKANEPNLLLRAKPTQLRYNKLEMNGSVSIYHFHKDNECSNDPSNHKVNLRYYIATTMDARDSHCILCANESRIVVSMRGSQTLVNWWSNATIPLTNLFDEKGNMESDIKIHKGFREILTTNMCCEMLGLGCCSLDCKCGFGDKACLSLECCMDQEEDRSALQTCFWLAIEKKIEELKKEYKDAVIIFTGHSLGGALAQTFALVYKERHLEDDIGCYTYAAPRSGNSAFRKEYERLITATWRFEVVRDRVPTIPLTCANCFDLCDPNGYGKCLNFCARGVCCCSCKDPTLGAYYHAGTSIMMDVTHQGMYFINPTFVERFTYNYFRCFLCTFVDRHKVERYMESLENYEEHQMNCSVNKFEDELFNENFLFVDDTQLSPGKTSQNTATQELYSSQTDIRSS